MSEENLKDIVAKEMNIDIDKVKKIPCPICGSKPDVFYAGHDSLRAGCSNDTCIMVFDDCGVPLELWNTRKSPDVEGAIEECKFQLAQTNRGHETPEWIPIGDLRKVITKIQNKLQGVNNEQD